MIKQVLLFVFLWLLIITYTSAQNINSDTLEGQNQYSVLSEKSDSGNDQNNNPSKKSSVKNAERFYIIKINLKINDDNKKELVNSHWELNTFSGQSVSVHVKGNNLIIKADMTPYYVDKKSILLLTKANVKLKPSDSDANNFYSTVNSLPIKLGEKALFFPLGLLDEKMENISSCVLEIEVQPYDNGESLNGPGSEQLGEKFQKE